MELSHFEESGRAVMVDVTEKKDTEREAEATGTILVNRQVFDAIKAGRQGGRAGSGPDSRDHGGQADL